MATMTAHLSTHTQQALASHRWAALNTRDFSGLDPARTVAVLPLGATEQHGPHLPLSVDTVLVDGVWATVGSTNLDWRGFLHNHELNAVVLGVDFGRQLQAMFDRDLASSRQISLAHWQSRSPALRLKEWFSGWWAYWL